MPFKNNVVNIKNQNMLHPFSIVEVMRTNDMPCFAAYACDRRSYREDHHAKFKDGSWDTSKRVMDNSSLS